MSFVTCCVSHIWFFILVKETLIIWGDKDNVFPVQFAHQLQRYIMLYILPLDCNFEVTLTSFMDYRHLGAQSRLEMIKDTGHAANIESPDAVNSLIKSFVLGTPNMIYSTNKLFKQSQHST